MIKLITNELKKIGKKKSTFITLGIFIALIVLINILVGYTSSEDFFADYTFSDENINYLTQEIQSLDPNNERDVDSYTYLKTDLDYIEFVNQYESSSWQHTIASQRSYDIINQIDTNRYIYKNEEAVASYEAELEVLKSKLDADDWQSFVIDEKEMLTSTIATIEASLVGETDKSVIDQLKLELEKNKIALYVANYRLENQVPFGNSYLNNALETYQNNSQSLLDFNTENMSNDEKKEYEEMQKDVKESKYVLDTKNDMLSYNNARNLLLTVFSDNMIFIIIFIVMIAGYIIAEEFSKGTIKMLLIRPFRRGKILLAKYISCLIMLVVVSLIIVATQYIAGGVAFGFDSYSITPIVYNYASESIIEVSLIQYLTTQFVAYLPMYLLLLTLAFTIGVVFTSTALSITLSLLTMIFSETVNALIIIRNVKFLKLFPTMVWDLSHFLYGATPTYEYVSLGASVGMSIIYLIILLIISFFVFKHKNIKNI